MSDTPLIMVLASLVFAIRGHALVVNATVPDQSVDLRKRVVEKANANMVAAFIMSLTAIAVSFG